MQQQAGFITLLLTFITVRSHGEHSKCGWGYLQDKIANYTSVAHEDRLLQTSDDYDPIRIHFELVDLDGFTQEQQDSLLNVVLPRVAKHFSNFLSVIRIAGPITLGTSDCGTCECIEGFPIPQKYQDGGGQDDTDYVILVRIWPLIAGTTTLAGAAPCVSTNISPHRNIIGIMVINPDLFTLAPTQQEQHASFVHELTHALGFNPFVDRWKNPNTGEAYDVNEILRTQFWDSYSTGQFAVVTPTVVEKVRSQSGCTDLEGALWENQGDVDSFPHWETRTFYGESMTAASKYELTSYSELTFALLVDTGWYQVDWSYAQPLSFGHKAGCDFHRTKCITYADDDTSQENPITSSDVFCTSDQAMSGGQPDMCSPNRRIKNACGLGAYPDDLPQEFQYFPDSKTGGLDFWADYCPIYNNFYSTNLDCESEDASITAEIGESNGPGSRCLVSSAIPAGYNTSIEPRAVCYKVVECKSDRVILRTNAISGLSLLQKEFECIFGQSEATITGFVGTVQCPPTDILCAPTECPSGCLGLGKCVDSACVCDDGYGGVDCSADCPAGCKSCNGPLREDCTVCFDGFGGDSCEINCHPSCKTCSGPGSNDCLSCYGSAVEISGECVCSDGLGGVDCAITCHEYCRKCSGTGSDDCLACYASAEVVNTSCQCIEGYIGDPNNCEFLVCHSSCKTCSGFGADECEECFDNASLNESNECVCDTGFEGLPENCFLVGICWENCATCFGDGENECSSCKDANARVSTINTCICRIGYVLLDGVCTVIENSYESCAGDVCIAHLGDSDVANNPLRQSISVSFPKDFKDTKLR